MIDFAVELTEKEQLSSKDAIYQACMIRFRPIMMTTLAAVFGALPIALGYGTGGEARQPMFWKTLCVGISQQSLKVVQ